MCLRYCTVLLVVCSWESGSGMDYVSERPHKDEEKKYKKCVRVWEREEGSAETPERHQEVF